MSGSCKICQEKKYTDTHTYVHIHIYIRNKINKMLIIVEHRSSLYYSILCLKISVIGEGREGEGGKEKGK